VPLALADASAVVKELLVALKTELPADSLSLLD
jgi:hypothetical protein